MCTRKKAPEPRMWTGNITASFLPAHPSAQGLKVRRSQPLREQDAAVSGIQAVGLDAVDPRRRIRARAVCIVVAGTPVSPIARASWM